MGKYSLGIVVCFFMQQSYAYIYEARIACRTLPGTREKQYIVGLSDFHDRLQQAVASEQRSMLEKLLKTVDTARVRFLVEDLSSPNCEGISFCANYRVNTRGGFLGGITELLKRYGCSADNLEFRYCRVVALGLIATGKDGKQAHRLQEAITIGQFVKETSFLFATISRYQDFCMNAWYRSCTKMVEESMHRLNLLACQKQTAGEYLREAIKKNKKEECLLEELLSYDSPLFDVRVVHELLNDTRHKTVVVIAGGTHIRETFTALEKVGYESVPIIQECLATSSIAVQKSLDASHAQKNSFVLPRPIALSCSKRFWPQKK